MSDAFVAIRAWNRKHRKDFKPVPEAMLKKALDTIDSEAEEFEELFCPKCGCVDTRTSENMASYPEMWVKTVCANCGFLVCEVDNSTPQHCFMYKDDDYQISI